MSFHEGQNRIPACHTLVFECKNDHIAEPITRRRRMAAVLTHCIRMSEHCLIRVGSMEQAGEMDEVPFRKPDLRLADGRLKRSLERN